jgi:FkbM family methyltransferase
MLARLFKVLKIMRHQRALRGLLGHRVAMTTEHLEVIRLAAPATLLDVGANKGQFSLAVRTLFPTAQIHAFEPLPDAQAQFARLFADDLRAKLHGVALSEQEGAADFHVADRADSSSLLPLAEGQKAAYGVGEAGTVTVAKRRLASEIDMATLAGPILLKIDVQGGELDVLKGIDDADFVRIDRIYIELSFVELYQGQPLFDEVYQFLAGHGYRLRGLFNPSRTHAFGLTQIDALFERVSDSEGIALL